MSEFDCVRDNSEESIYRLHGYNPGDETGETYWHCDGFDSYLRVLS